MAVKHHGANAEFSAALTALDADLKALQVRYEKYFLGLERREPAEDHTRLRKAVMALKRQSIRNTALKFRLDSLWNKLLSYERMWNRVSKEIEEGRYRRDVFKAKLRGYDLPSAGSASKSTKPAADSSNERKQGAAGALSDDRVDGLYRALVTAKKRCKENVSGITRDTLAKSLRRQIPALKSKHKGKNLEFKVVIKGGKAVIKAVPR